MPEFPTALSFDRLRGFWESAFRPKDIHCHKFKQTKDSSLKTTTCKTLTKQCLSYEQSYPVFVGRNAVFADVLCIAAFGRPCQSLGGQASSAGTGAWLSPASSNGAGQPLAAVERPGNRVRQAYGAPCPGNERIPPGLRTVDEALGSTRIAPGQALASRTADCRPRLPRSMIFCSRISPGSYLLFLLFKLVVVDKECGHLWTGVDSSFATSTWRSPVHVRSPASGVSRAREQLHSPPGFCG